MAANRLELPIVATDQTAAGVESAKRQFRSVEEEARRAAAGATKSFDRARDAQGRFLAGAGAKAAKDGLDGAARSLAGLDRAIAGFERRTSTAGLRGLDKIRAQSAALVKQAGDDERAIQRILAARRRAEDNFARSQQRSRGAAASASRFAVLGSGLTGAAVRASFLSIPAGVAAKRAIDVSTQLEMARVGFTTNLGSQAAADKHIADLQKFAKTTPFEFTSLIGQSQYLQAQTFAVQEILPILQAFGNAVAASGGNTAVLERVLLQVGQMKGQGKAQWKDLKPIAEAGVPVVPILADAFRRPGDDQTAAQARVFKALEQGNLKADPVINYLMQRFLNDPKYAGMLQKQSQTQGGMLSNLKDSTDQFFAEIGKGMGPTVKTFAGGATEMIDKAKELAIAFQGLPQPIKDTAVAMTALGIAAPGFLFFLGAAAPLLSPMVKGFGLLRGAVVAFTAAATFVPGSSVALTVAGTRALTLINILKGFSIPALVATGLFAFFKMLERHGGKPLDAQTESVKKLNAELQKGTLNAKFAGTGQSVNTPPPAAPGGRIPDSLLDFARKKPGAPGTTNPFGLDDPEKVAEAKARAKALASAEKQALRDVFAAQDDNLSEFAKLRAGYNAKVDQLKEEGVYRGKVPGLRRQEFFQQMFSLSRKQAVSKADDAVKRAMDDGSRALEFLEENRQRGGEARSEFLKESYALDEQLRQQDFSNRENDLQRRRELEMAALETINAQTTQSKIEVEERRLAIELQYLERSKAIAIEKINYERSIAHASLLSRTPFDMLGSDEYRAAKSKTDQLYDQQIAAATNDNLAQRDKAVMDSASRRSQMVIDENRRLFDSLKSSASGIFDALFSRTQSFGDAIKNTLKTAILTPLKEILASQTAAAIMRLVTGTSVTFEGNNSGGRLGGLRAALGRFGLGAPRFSGGGIEDVKLVNNAVPVYVMNAAGPANPAQAVTQAAAGGLAGKVGAIAGIGGALGLAGVLKAGSKSVGRSVADVAIDYGDGGAKDVFPGAGSVFTSGTDAVLGPGGTSGFAGPLGGQTTASMLTNPRVLRINPLSLFRSPLGFLRQLGGIGGPKLGPGSSGGMLAAPGVQGALGGAMLLGGGTLAALGLKRGGVSGMLMTAAGGALIGAKFGGPVGALIGGAIGLGAGFARLFVKSAEQKAKEKIRNAYGLNVTDKGVLKQIVQMSKESFGGNLDMAIRSPQVRELLELYAMSTGQNFGVQSRVRPVSLTQSGSGLYQNPIYENGRAIAFSGIGTRTSADVIPGNSGGLGMPTNYAQGPVVVNANINLDGKATTSVLRGETVNVINSQPRTVQQASNNAFRGNYGRRETVAQLLEPGALTS